MLAHTEQHANRSTAAPEVNGYVPYSQPANLRILRERPDVAATRIASKRRVRVALLEQHGTVKLAFLAALLGHRSTELARRCLNESERDEFSEVHCVKLGIAGDRRAA